jgi:hypothetical protein
MKLIPKKYHASDIVTAGLFILLPFWTLPLAVFQFIKTRRTFYALLISFFFGLTASLLAPTGDLYRLYIIYFDFQDSNFQDFLNYIEIKPDFLFYLLLYTFAKLGLSVRLIIFAIVFSYFHISFKLLLKQVTVISAGVIILFVMQFDFLLQGLFLRFPMAMLIVIYAFIRNLEGRKYVLIWLIIASMVHFAALITIPLYFLSKLRLKKLNILFLISLFVMPFGSYIFIFLTTHLLEYFPEIPLKLKIESYFLGYWALEYFEDRTWKFLVQFYTERLLYILLLLYFVLTKKSNKYRLQVIPFLILINVLFSFPNLFSRYASLAIFFGLYTLIIEQGKSTISRFIKLAVIIIIPVVFSIRIVAQQKNIRAGYIPKVLYTNVVSLSFKKYDKQWIEKNIDKETARPKNIESL